MSALDDEQKDRLKTVNSFSNEVKWITCKQQFDSEPNKEKILYFEFDWEFFALEVYYKHSNDFKKLLRLKKGSVVYVFPYGLTEHLGKIVNPGLVRYDKKNRFAFTKAVKEFVTLNMNDREKRSFIQVIAKASLIVIAEKGVEAGKERLVLHDVVIWRKLLEVHLLNS